MIWAAKSLLQEAITQKLLTGTRCSAGAGAGNGLFPNISQNVGVSIKVGCISHDMRILGRIVGVRTTEQSVSIAVGGF